MFKIHQIKFMIIQGKSFETINQLIYFLYHDEFDKTKEITNEMIGELREAKEYFQLNQNSIINLFLEDLFSRSLTTKTQKELKTYDSVRHRCQIF
ncbi:hypothetical protein M0811_02336 [Anaeramoeba ignava]|uniref:Uncharacterized protein n=1 Tax=Anaeramoeba ignava TaxID=1746090 RepID=A0A9Q0R788_ANAIG|nr:hypothetical protein M0811_02336 [Anaeramoeba ignava]